MMTQMTLGDAEAVRRRNMHHAAGEQIRPPEAGGYNGTGERRRQGCRRYMNQILIANARLTFGVSHTKHRLLKISNRERIAIFCSLKGESENKGAGRDAGGAKGNGANLAERRTGSRGAPSICCGCRVRLAAQARVPVLLKVK
jgi:hypothetical protein